MVDIRIWRCSPTCLVLFLLLLSLPMVFWPVATRVFQVLPQPILSILSIGSISMASSSSAKYSMVFVTVPKKEVADKLADGLVSNKHAACVNIIPGITSVYEWQGKVERDQEMLLMIKTSSDKVKELSDYVKANHPYDVPEVIAADITQGSQKYLDWIGETVSGK